MSTTPPPAPAPEQKPEPTKRCIHCLVFVNTQPKEGEALPCCGKPRYRTTNWKQYNAALKARGSLSIWLDKRMA